jgi:hypothetical protein
MSVTAAPRRAMLRAGQCKRILRLLVLPLLLASASRPVGLEAVPAMETAGCSSWNFCFDPKATERGTGEGRRSPQRAVSSRTAPLGLAAQPKSAEERGSEGGERSGRAEGHEGAVGAGEPSPTSVEHPAVHASTGRGADARDEEASDKARVGRGRHRRNMVAGQVVDPGRLVSLVLSMGGARSLTAKRRWRVSLSAPARVSASHASDTPAFLASLLFPSSSLPSPPRLRLSISTCSSCFSLLCF